MKYPPRGEEKKALQIIQRICRKIEKLGGELESLCFDLPEEDTNLDGIDWLITPSHALEGVRINGREMTRTLASFAINKRRLMQLPKQISAVAEQVGTALRDIVKVCEAFKLCPSCKGRCGSWDGKPRAHDSHWDDCSKCKGRGVLELKEGGL